MAKFRKVFRKVAKVAAVATVAWFAAPLVAGALASGGAGSTIAAGAVQARLARQRAGGPDPSAVQYYSAPFNPGYSYTGPPDAYTGAAFQTAGGYGGAAIPAFQSGGDAPPTAGFRITPVFALAGLGVLLLGFMAFRR